MFANILKRPVQRISGEIVKREFKNAKYVIHKEFSNPDKSENIISEGDFKQFISIFPTVVEDLLENIPEDQHFKNHFEQLFYYNVPNGARRGLRLLSAYKQLESLENLTNENIKLANIFGWCIEMLQSSGIIHDDIMDASEIRRGIKCWYRRENIDMQAIEDGRIISKGIYFILKKYFYNHHYYVQFLESFQEIETFVRMGQALDGIYVSNGLQSFNMNNYYTLSKYKTYHLFALPIMIAMCLSKKYDRDIYEEAKPIFYGLGNLFQINNDFKDCFSHSTIGSGIRQGKFTWLVSLALQKGTMDQKRVLERHYGRNDQESEVAVYNLYNQLCIIEEYRRLKLESYNSVLNDIQALPKSLLQNVFYNCLEELRK